MLFAPQELLAPVFSAVRRNGGNIDSLEWSGGECALAVSGCTGEAVSGDMCCQVSCTDGEPRFAVKAAGLGLVRCARSTDERSGADGGLFVARVRSQLYLLGCAILGERVAGGSCAILFLCGGGNIACALSFLAECAAKRGLSETAVCMRRRGRRLSVRVSFSAAADSCAGGFPSLLAVCARNADVLCGSSPRPARRNVARLVAVEAKDIRAAAFHALNVGTTETMEEKYAN